MSPIMTPGIHDVTVAATTLNDQGAGGCIAVTFRNKEGDHITDWWYCSDAAWPYTADRLRAIGCNPVDYDYDLAPLNDVDQSPVVGNQTRIVVALETYQGKERARVTAVGYGTGRTEPLAEDKAKAFTTALRARLIAAAAARSSGSQRVTRRTTAAEREIVESYDEEVPF